MIIRKDKLDGNDLVYLGKGEFVRVRASFPAACCCQQLGF